MRLELSDSTKNYIRDLAQYWRIDERQIHSLIDYVYTNYPELDENSVVDAVGYILGNFTKKPEKAKKFLDVYLKLLEYETTYWDVWDHVDNFGGVVYEYYDAKYYMQKIYDFLKKQGLTIDDFVFLVNTAERFYKYFNPLISINYRPGSKFFECYNPDEEFYKKYRDIENVRYIDFMTMLSNTINLYVKHNFDKEKTIESLSVAAKTYLELPVKYKDNLDAEKVFEYVFKGYDNPMKIVEELKQELEQERKRKEVKSVEPSL